MDFPKLSRQYAAEGANLMLVPAWDFNLDRWLHARMAVLRAVENGFALARSARNGLLTLSDNRGRILTEVPTVPGRFVSITRNVNVTREETFYTRTGDWFPWLSIAMFVILLPLSAAHAHLVTTEKDANERLQKWLPLLQTKDIEDTEPLLETWLGPN